MITAGLDIGTRFAKICIVDQQRMIGFACSGVDKKISALIHELSGQAMHMAGIGKGDVAATALTGYGAGLVKMRGKVLTGARCTVAAFGTLPSKALAVVDVGGIFIQAAAVGADGRIINSATNEKCAAGGGKFLEMVCQALQTDIADLSSCVEKSLAPHSISSNCAVFAESEVVSQVNAGVPPNDVLAGVVDLVASRAATLVERVSAKGPVVLAGGVARIPVFKTALEKRIARPVVLPDFNPQLAAAYGAALLAADYKR